MRKALREVVLDAVFFHAAEGRIGDDHIDAVLGAVVAQRASQGVVVADLRGHVDAVEDHVGHAQEVRQRLLLDAAACCPAAFASSSASFTYFLRMCSMAQVEKAAGAAGGVEDGLAELGVHLVDDELGDGARGVVLARVARVLQVGQDLLVDVAELVPVAAAC